MSAFEGFYALRDWCARKTVLEMLLLSPSDWPFRLKVQIHSFTPEPPTLNLIEECSNRSIPWLDLAGAEIKWRQPEDDLPPFAGLSFTEFKGFLFLKLQDGKHLVIVERRFLC